MLQKELGDVVYVELPEVGASVVQGENFGVVESVKVGGRIAVSLLLMKSNTSPFPVVQMTLSVLHLLSAIFHLVCLCINF